jgi:hypothetical protein
LSMMTTANLADKVKNLGISVGKVLHGLRKLLIASSRPTISAGPPSRFPCNPDRDRLAAQQP